MLDHDKRLTYAKTIVHSAKKIHAQKDSPQYIKELSRRILHLGTMLEHELETYTRVGKEKHKTR